VGNAAATQHRARKAIADGVFARDDANVAGTLEENGIFGQQGIIFSQAAGHQGEKIAHGFFKFYGHITPEAAGADIGGHHAGAGDQLKNIQDNLALAHTVEEDRHGCQVEG